MNYLLNIRYNLVHFVDTIFGLGIEMSVWFIFFITGLFVILFLFKLILKKISKKLSIIKQKLIYEYDNIFYLLSLSQYQQELDKKSLAGNPCVAAIIPIFNMKNPNYISNHSMINSNIKKVELLLGKQVISDNIRNKINNFHKKLNFISLAYKILKLLLILILLFGIAVFVYIFSI